VFEITDTSLGIARIYWEGAENNIKKFKITKKARDPKQCSGKS